MYMGKRMNRVIAFIFIAKVAVCEVLISECIVVCKSEKLQCF